MDFKLSNYPKKLLKPYTLDDFFFCMSSTCGDLTTAPSLKEKSARHWVSKIS